MTEEYIDTSKMKIRVVSDRGWDYGAAVTIAQLCRKYNLPFIDRAGVADNNTEHEQAVIPTVIFCEDNKLPSGYIFFTHRKMPDLPFTHNAQAAVVEPPVKKPAVEFTNTAPTSNRKIVDGTKRTRSEFKELQAKCKAAGSFHEWLTAMHDVLLVPKHTVAKIIDGKIVWGVSPERATFEWLDETSMTEFVPKSILPELASLLKAFSTTGKLPRVIKTERPLSNKTNRSILIDAYCRDKAIEVDESDVWVLVIKPVTVENGLY